MEEESLNDGWPHLPSMATTHHRAAHKMAVHELLSPTQLWATVSSSLLRITWEAGAAESTHRCPAESSIFLESSRFLCASFCPQKVPHT